MTAQPSAGAQGEAVAWQARLAGTGAWWNVHPEHLKMFQSDSAYETRPLYATPAQPPAHAVDIVPSHCTGASLSFEPGVLYVSKDGSGYIAIDERHFSLEDDRCDGPDGPEGSVHWITRMDASEVVALRDFLNGSTSTPAQPAVTATDVIAYVRKWLDADDPTAWGPFERGLHRAISSQPDTGDVEGLREALTLAANRIDRLSLEMSIGTARDQAVEWAEEARAGLPTADRPETDERERTQQIINERDAWIVDLIQERDALIALVREGMEEAIPDALIFGMHTNADTWIKAKKDMQAWCNRAAALSKPNAPGSNEDGGA